jgi:hypothetical protein
MGVTYLKFIVNGGLLRRLMPIYKPLNNIMQNGVQ